MHRLSTFVLFASLSCGGITATQTDGGDASTGSSNTILDAASDAPKADATTGSSSDPGVVTCNGSPCDTATSYCCDETTVPPNGQRCVSNSVSSCGGLRRRCDEAADCTGGQVCCIPPNAAMRVAYTTVCSKGPCTDDVLNYQVCKTSAECTNGQPCVTQQCAGYEMRTCGSLPVERCR